jgi:hypothetical protein
MMNIPQQIATIPHRLRRQRKAIFIGLGIGFTGYLVQQLLHLGNQLNLMGQEGDHQAQVWGLVIAIIGLLLSLVSIIVPVWLRNSENKSTEKPSAQPTSFTIVSFIISLACALGAYFAPAGINNLMFWQWETQDVTSQAVLTDVASMQDGDRAHISLPATGHSRLKMMIHLESLAGTGSCVSPARITIKPSRAAESQVPITIASSQWATLDIQPSNDNHEFDAVISIPDEPYCSVKLNLDSVVYYQ